MVAPAPTLDLYTPGLVHAWTAAEAAGVPIPAAPSMQLALARGIPEPSPVAQAGTELEAVLCSGFGLDPDCGVAPFTWLADGGDADQAWWLRADPVHLQADQDRVLLFAGDVLNLEAGEAEQLRAILNEHFQDRGWRFDTPVTQRWYLRLEDAPRIDTVPLHQVVGRDINIRMPQGADGGPWRALLTEVQMLLHDTPVNREREARGEPMVNSLWFWGGGRLPDRRQPCCWDSIGSDEPLARGLALWSGARLAPLPDRFTDWSKQAGSGRHLLVLEQLQRLQRSAQPQPWHDAVVALERDWLAPALRSLRSGALQALRWWPGGAHIYRIERRQLRRFWRRGMSLPIVAKDGTP